MPRKSEPTSFKRYIHHPTTKKKIRIKHGKENIRKKQPQATLVYPSFYKRVSCMQVKVPIHTICLPLQHNQTNQKLLFYSLKHLHMSYFIRESHLHRCTFYSFSLLSSKAKKLPNHLSHAFISFPLLLQIPMQDSTLPLVHKFT
ncbi:hypothetical protein CDL12_08888 [Handroanthus impetiginosus]|uniref:Uncharacterized protein n=1 Tax=Handroanthus impetiginosus TaxID=429701 RepID=A0A2G9HLQ2_9LAMI|nr:hypothetical protein CDL12_08888 [Handroanthus impetiginosus]